MRFQRSHKGLMSEINVTPMVDVMLVLLIIFMVAAPMMLQGVDVNLPKTDSKPIVSDEERLVVSIQKDGSIYINKYKTPVETLASKLKNINKTRQDKSVFLKADQDVSYGIVANVMAAIKNAGIEKLGIVTEASNQNKNQQ
uniref:Biopolymer transport protein n=1 Tax=uncultured delta proteobacterium TaxID=34034 RepID=Q2YZT5_9DELT|nr:biopolymer transport protein [uncultured delta proteobacterium]